MTIWVDADACPVSIKEVLYRAADRRKIRTVLVANRLLRVPPSAFISATQVPAGFDVADHHIVSHMQAGDLVITGDIPLAAQVLAQEGHALNPRGELYTVHNIQERLAMRDFMESLRSSGVETGGPAALKPSDTHAFAAELDRFLQRLSSRLL